MDERLVLSVLLPWRNPVGAGPPGHLKTPSLQAEERKDVFLTSMSSTQQIRYKKTDSVQGCYKQQIPCKSN